MRIFLIGILLVLMFILRYWHAEEFSNLPQNATISLGFLLLAGHLLGQICSQVKLPKITGYILGGILAGPYILNVLSQDVVKQLQIVDELALTLIAFTAGGEMQIEKVKRAFFAIISIVSFRFLSMLLIVTAGFWLVSNWISFYQGMSSTHVFLASLLFGIVSVAKSPSATIAIIVESKAKGQMTDVVLGCTILMDIVVVIGFTLVVGTLIPILGEPGALHHTLPELLLGIVKSIVFGIIMGIGNIFYLKFIGRNRTVFIFLSSLLLLTVAHAYHLEFLIAAIVSGFVVENYSKHGLYFIHTIERASMPVYLIFFTIAGASLDLNTFRALWVIAVFLFVIRLIATIFSTWLGATLAKQGSEIKKYGWTGFISQAGVSLGFAITIGESFPAFGLPMRDVIIGSIVLTQIFGPILFKIGLTKAGNVNN